MSAIAAARSVHNSGTAASTATKVAHPILVVEAVSLAATSVRTQQGECAYWRGQCSWVFAVVAVDTITH